MVACTGCGNKVFHPHASPGESDDQDDWLSLTEEPTRETLTKSPIAKPIKNDEPPLEVDGLEIVDVDSVTDMDGESSPAGNFLDGDESFGEDQFGEDQFGDDDFGEFSMAPETARKRSPEVDVENLFDNLDLPDRPPQPVGGGSGDNRGGQTAADPLARRGVNQDSLAMPAKAASKDLLSSHDQSEYRVKCRVCDSVMFVHPDKAGSVIECSDCNTKIRVPPPPKQIPGKPATPVRPSTINGGGSTSIGDGMSLRGGPVATRPADPYAKSANDLLDKASREDLDETEENYDIPDIMQWALGVVSIFADIGVIAHWLILGTFGAIAAGFVSMIGHPGLGILLFPGAGIFGLLVLACGFAILESTANNTDDIENWPTLDMSLLIDNVIVTGAAVLVSGLPAFIAVFLVFGNSLVTVAVSMLSIYMFFPFILLSILDSGSVVQPFSSEVARSVNKCHESWGGLYFSAAVLFAGLFFAILISGSLGPIPGAALVVFSFIAVVFTYFAMIGRLAYAIGQSVRHENAKLRDEPEAEAS